MKKKSFLSVVHAKMALLTLALSGVLIAGCYKEDGLDASKPGETVILPDAAYTISGSVTDIETGDAVNLTAVETNVGTATILSDGSYAVKISKFTESEKVVNLVFKADGYKEAKRTVYVAKIEDGQTVVYPLSVVMKKDIPEKEYVDVVYGLTFVVKNAETGEVINDIVPEVAPSANADGKYAAGEYLVRTVANDKYYSSATVVSLPVMQVEKGEDNVVNKIVELLVEPVPVDEPEKPTYVNISGAIVDKNGKALEADEIGLYAGGQAVETVSSTSNFRFTVKKADVTYQVIAKKGTVEVKSAIVNANGGNYDCVLVFTAIGEDATVKLPYVLDVNVVDADTKLPVNADVKIDGAAVQASYDAGIYTVTATATGYKEAKVKVALEVVYGKAGDKTYRVIDIEMVKEDKPEIEYIRIYGEVVDKYGILAQSQLIKLEGVNIQPVYNSSTFEFTVEKGAAASYTIYSEVVNSTATGVIAAKAKVTIADATAYYQVLAYPCKVENGKEVIESGEGATGTIIPDVDASGNVQETVSNIMADGTTVTLKENTVISPADATLILVRNLADEKNPGDNENPDSTPLSLRSYIGLPDGMTFTGNPLVINFADEYNGQLGDLNLEYEGTDGVWSVDPQGSKGVKLSGGVYTMNIEHFSKFRAAIDFSVSEAPGVEKNDYTSFPVGRMNNNDTEIDVHVTCTGLKAGVKYENYDQLVAEVKQKFSNENAQNVMLTAIQNAYADVKKEFETVTLEGDIKVPAFTLLNSVSVETKEVTKPCTATVNNIQIQFNILTVEYLKVVTLEKDMTHIGHSHGHGNDLNAGGGIVVGE